MITLYYYCSYDGSPVGFNLGKIELQEHIPVVQELSDTNIDTFIRGCFETGILRSAFGKINNLNSDNEYFLLKRKLVCKKDNCNYYMNIAIVTDEWNQFCSFMKGSDEDNRLAEIVMNTMIVSNNEKFGYSINTDKIIELLSVGYEKICECNMQMLRRVENEDAFFVILSTQNPDINLLRSKLCVAQNSGRQLIDITGKSGRIISFGKKKTASIRNQIVIMLAVIIMIVLGICVLK